MSKLEIVRTGEGEAEGLTLGDIDGGESFVFTDRCYTPVHIETPCLRDICDERYTYLNDGLIIEITDDRMRLPVRRITAKLTWDYE